MELIQVLCLLDLKNNKRTLKVSIYMTHALYSRSFWMRTIAGVMNRLNCKSLSGGIRAYSLWHIHERSLEEIVHLDQIFTMNELIHSTKLIWKNSSQIGLIQFSGLTQWSRRSGLQLTGGEDSIILVNYIVLH